MNSIEEYENLVELLKQVLAYYADDNTYTIFNTGNETKSNSIMIDKGFQAKFALQKIKELEEIYDKIDLDYLKSIENHEITSETILKTIKNIKNDIWYGN